MVAYGGLLLDNHGKCCLDDPLYARQQTVHLNE